MSCSEKKEQTRESSINTPLFTVLDANETGLNFVNKLEESTTMNGFYYEYFYNGGGVGVADFNNDGLQDVYFISNLRTNKLYLNQGGLKFKNVSVKANAQGDGGFPTGVSIVDINNDGLKDIYILKSGRFETDDLLRNELLINTGVDADGVPVFEEKAAVYNLDLPHYSTQASFFDYDKDGDLDMFLINHNIEMYGIEELEQIAHYKSDKIGEKLYRNDNGKFVNVTEDAGIISNNIGFGLGVAIGDVNNDGWPDVYTSNDYYEKDHLYLNNTDGTFTESALEAFNHISTFSMGNDMADIDNDGFLDIISLDMMAEDNYTQKTSMSGMNVANFYKIENLGLHRQYMYNTLQINNGVSAGSAIPVFSDLAQLAGVSSTDWSWAPLLFDMDNDGHKDLFVTNGIKRDFRNNDFSIYLEEKYQENIRRKKVDLAKHVGDLLDKMPGRKTKNYLFLNDKDLRFHQLELEQPATFSNGAAYADFDNDGDLDVIVNNIDDFAHLYRNNVQNTSYIDISLTGPQENKDGLGARVVVSADGKEYLGENYFSRGFQSAMAGPMHFGLSNVKNIETVTVTWPDGKQQILKNVATNQVLDIVYKPSGTREIDAKKRNFLFHDVTERSDIIFRHKENTHNDFDVESLLPHKMSQFGPALSVADINGDGLEDFFIGGAMGQSSALFLQSNRGEFARKSIKAFESDKQHEDTGSLFFDADGDGDQDLYVVSGGNEMAPDNEYYQDRLYLNDGSGSFKRDKKSLPFIAASGQVVKAADFDKDGDLDLFVGSRVQPLNYGVPVKSYLFENRLSDGEGKFVDVTEKLCPDLVEHGMVTDALWADIDDDGNLELVIAQEWGSIEIFKYTAGQFENKSEQFGVADQIGWWSGLAANDIDNDGDIDLIAGNLGLNYKYKASESAPFHLYVNDFDKNDSNDIVLGYEQDSALYPLRGRECTSNQMPFIKKKFKTYDAFAKAELKEVYGDGLENSLHRAANNFASCILENKNNTSFEFKPLPNRAQISSVNKILVTDNDNTKKDLILLGNLYASEVETPRNDASYGLYLTNNGSLEFKAVPSSKSGLYVRGDVRGASFIALGDAKKKGLLIARNDDTVMLLQM
ncbi:VCBS repeat-containing protein [Kriegella aquimaris]|nr:VCBS repeat-containing protein [Kriegella aquimaris]